MEVYQRSWNDLKKNFIMFLNFLEQLVRTSISMKTISFTAFARTIQINNDIENLKSFRDQNY